MSVLGFLKTKDYQHFRIGEEGPAFDGAERAGRALPGDEVIGDEASGCTLMRRTEHPPLAGVLDLTSKYVYGMTSRGHPLYLFRPLDEAYPPFIVGSAEKDRTRNILVLVRFERWEEGAKLPQGSIQEVFGSVGDLAAEKLALVWRYCPWRYNSKTVKEDDGASDSQAREIIQTPYIFNIDPEGCRDIDDVLSLDFERSELGISIADVAATVDKLDSEALLRGATLYLDRKAVRPMLPLGISEGSCSLVAGCVRRAVTLFYNWNTGAIRWATTSLVNKTSYTYEEARCSLPPLVTAKLDELSGSTDPHRWVEWAMLTYNKEAAKKLIASGRGILRSQAGASQKKLDALAQAGLDEEDLQVLAMEAAEYCLVGSDGDLAHYMLDLPAYTHASSPIRRYCDLLNQRILKGDEGVELSEGIVDWLNVRQREIKRFERDVCYLNAVAGEEAPVEGVYLGDARVYIRSWKRIIRLREEPTLAQPGQSLQIDWFVDWQQTAWKRRVIFCCASGQL